MITYRCKQGGPQWHALRLGRATASVFDKIVTPAKGEPSKQADGLAYKLAAERILGYSLDGITTAAMEAGREGEPRARAWYQMANECEVEEVGVCFTDDGKAGASPDVLVGNDGLVEIKCPTPAVHVGYLMDDWGTFNDYRCQCLGQLWVCEREWLDTVSYCPPFIVATRRIYRDEPFIQKLSAAVLQFADKVDEVEQKLLAMGNVPMERESQSGDSRFDLTDADVEAILASKGMA